MRYLSFLLVIVFVFFGVSCRENILNSSGDITEAASPQARNQDGLILQIAGVETGGEIVKLGLKATNGSEDKISLGDNYDKLILRDNLGNEYQAKGENLDLLPLTVNDLQIEFLAKLPSDAKTLSLVTNSKSSSTREPRLVIENIPVPDSGKVAFASAPNPPNLTLSDKSANHPNGTSFTVNQINFGENTIDISFQAVNGNNSDNSFSTRNNSAFLQDDKSNRYFLIPSSSGNEIKLAQREKMAGTLRFAGKIAPDATKLSVHLNDRSGGDNEYSRTPKIIVSDIQIRR